MSDERARALDESLPVNTTAVWSDLVSSRPEVNVITMVAALRAISGIAGDVEHFALQHARLDVELEVGSF